MEVLGKKVDAVVMLVISMAIVGSIYQAQEKLLSTDEKIVGNISKQTSVMNKGNYSKFSVDIKGADVVAAINLARSPCPDKYQIIVVNGVNVGNYGFVSGTYYPYNIIDTLDPKYIPPNSIYSYQLSKSNGNLIAKYTKKS